MAHGQFSGELLNQMTELVQVLSDPAALMQFVAMIGGMAALKKMACKVGVSGTAGALLTAKDAAETGLKLYEIKQELDAVTYKAEVANAAPHVAKVMAELVASLSFSALLRRIKCFAAGTQIAVAMSRNDDGTWRYETKSIEDIRGVEEAGDNADWVLAREELGDKVELRRVLRTVCHSSDHLRVLEFEDSTGKRQTIRTTDEHPFWVVNSQRYVPAEYLEVGQSFAGPNGETHTLVVNRRETHSNGIPVYNFEVDGFHTYFVAENQKAKSPILAHNQQQCVTPNVTKDDRGRIRASRATITEENLYGGTPTTRASRDASRPDDAGHIIGRLLGGRGGADSDNTFPQLPAVNRGSFAKHESWVADQVRGGKHVEVEIKLIYPNAVTMRPSRIKYITIIDGEEFVEFFAN